MAGDVRAPPEKRRRFTEAGTDTSSCPPSLTADQVHEAVAALRARGGELPLTSVGARIHATPAQLLTPNVPWTVETRLVENRECAYAKILGHDQVDIILHGFWGPPSQPSAPAMTAPVSHPAASPQVEAFLASHRVEAHAAEQLRTLPEELQMLVVKQGPLHFAREPTAVLIARIAKARQGELSESTSQHFTEQRPGDWTCPSCKDLQFAKNTHCRKCGTPNPEKGSLVPGAEAFLKQTGVIQPHVIQQFRSLQPAQQRLVMDSGRLQARETLTQFLSEGCAVSTQVQLITLQT